LKPGQPVAVTFPTSFEAIDARSGTQKPVSGRIGLWSKADSHMYFSDYTVTTGN
jgi:hypothetical protein